MDIFKRLREMLQGRDRKKLVENAVIIIIIGIILIIAASTFLSGGKKAENSSVTTAGKQQENTQEAVGVQSVDTNAERLKTILSRIKGVGRVEVMITYVSGGESIPAFDTRKSESTTEEKDSGGGTRTVTQGQNDSSVVYEDIQGGGKSPVILKEMQPEAKGVVVVADGAGDPEVTEKLYSAVQVLMDIPAHRIKVLQMQK